MPPPEILLPRAAAYAARAGLVCFVIIPDGHIALGKLSQAVMHGAKVLAIQGNFDDAFSYGDRCGPSPYCNGG